LLLLSVLAVAAFNGQTSDKMRSAARVAQSAFLGAKDRAMHAKDFRGVRLTVDANGPTFPNGIPCLVNGFGFIQPFPQPTSAGIAVTRPKYAAGGPDRNEAFQIIIPAGDAFAFNQQDSRGQWPAKAAWVQIPKGGTWYQINAVSSVTPYYGPLNNDGTLTLNFAVTSKQDVNGNTYFASVFQAGKPPVFPTFNAIDPADSNASIAVRLGSESLPFHSPMPMPAGTVIDMRYCSDAVQLLAGVNLAAGSTATPIDITFSPRGNLLGVIGTVGIVGPLSFVLRDLGDATQGLDPSSPNVKGDCLVVTVNPQTGLVQTFPADLTDANGDGIVDNIFSFAQLGKAAAR
jgi:hypothetical protein